MDTTTMPSRIQNRTDAARLWLFLLNRGISFHWEDDPSDWVEIDSGRRCLTKREAAAVRRGFAEVTRLDDERCYSDACKALRYTLVNGLEALSRLEPKQLIALRQVTLAW